MGGPLRRIVLFATLVGAGFGVRSLAPVSLTAGQSAWWPWSAHTTINLYFSDGRFLFPVSRRAEANADLPRAALEALLTGPGSNSGLTSPIPRGVQIRSIEVSDRVAHIDLSSAFLDSRYDPELARSSLVETMTALPDIHAVALSVEGRPVAAVTARLPVRYLASADGLVALAGTADGPRAAAAAYLSDPAEPALTALPRDVRLLDFRYDAVRQLVSLNFSYTDSVRTLAIEQPDRMRLVLLGLIATLTEFPDVRSVGIDFEGRTQLGLGQCSDLLRTPQPRPRLLNDERLLER